MIYVEIKFLIKINEVERFEDSNVISKNYIN
jgi:hypothetical protein